MIINENDFQFYFRAEKVLHKSLTMSAADQNLKLAELCRISCLKKLEKEDSELHALYLSTFDQKTDPFLTTVILNNDEDIWISYMLSCLRKGRYNTIRLSKDDPTFKDRFKADMTRGEMWGKYITPYLWTLISKRFGMQVGQSILDKVKVQTAKEKTEEQQKALLAAINVK